MGLLTGTLQRREDWPERLAEVVRQAQDAPYVLGEWDCLQFCCRAIEAMCGVDLWPHFSGYRTKRQALVTIARIAPSFAEAVTTVLAVDPHPVRHALRGDVMFYRDPTGEEHLGLCLGGTAAVLAPDGLLQIPLSDAGLLCSWRIG